MRLETPSTIDYIRFKSIITLNKEILTFLSANSVIRLESGLRKYINSLNRVIITLSAAVSCSLLDVNLV